MNINFTFPGFLLKWCILFMLLILSFCAHSQESAHIVYAPKQSNTDRVIIKDSLMPFLTRQLKRHALTGNNDTMAFYLFELGYAYANEVRMDSALYYFQQAMPFARRAAHYIYRVRGIYQNIGYIYFNLGYYNLALKYFNTAASPLIGVHPASPEFQAQNFNGMGAVYFQFNRFDEALRFFEISKTIAEKAQQKGLVAQALKNEAAVYNALNRTAEAEQSLLQVLNLYVKSNTKDHLNPAVTTYIGLAQLKLRQGKSDTAIQLLKKAQLLSEHNYYHKIDRYITIPHYLGLFYMHTGDCHTGVRYLNVALHWSKQLNINSDQLRIQENLYSAYHCLGNYKEAYEHLHAYMILKDSMLSREKEQDINKFSIEYQASEKERELAKQKLAIASQQLASQRKSKYIWITSTCLLFVTGVSLFNYYSFKNRQNKLRHRLNTLEQEQKISLLQTSITSEEQERIRIGKELHDGIGGLLSAAKLQLGSLRLKYTALTTEQDMQKAIQLVDEATTEMRKTAHNLMPQLLLQHGILPALKQFCQRVTVSNGPDIKLQTYGKIPRMETSTELSIYRVVQELTNNALKHAHASHILIQLNWQNSNFHIAVEDDGIGISAHEGVYNAGLHNVASRIEALGGNIEIDSVPGKGTSVYIDLNTERLG